MAEDEFPQMFIVEPSDFGADVVLQHLVLTKIRSYVIRHTSYARARTHTDRGHRPYVIRHTRAHAHGPRS